MPIGVEEVTVQICGFLSPYPLNWSRNLTFLLLLPTPVKPEAWLSSGPPPRPGHLRLVCHVSGFYPKPVRVTWLRGEQEQPGAQQGAVMPNADWTWHLRVTLDVVAAEAAGLSCRVKHSSLGDQDIILYWGEEDVEPSWGWEEVVLKHREGDTGRGEI